MSPEVNVCRPKEKHDISFKELDTLLGWLDIHFVLLSKFIYIVR